VIRRAHAFSAPAQADLKVRPTTDDGLPYNYDGLPYNYDGLAYGC
jgi:hypothetical protein